VIEENEANKRMRQIYPGKTKKSKIKKVNIILA
jgi:hypothetical protein